MPDAAIGDFNGDGRSDLAISSPSLLPDGGGAVSIMLGNGDGTFERKADYPAGRYDMSLAVGDFNGDGKDDLMMKEVNNLINWAPAVPFSISIAIGKGDGTFLERKLVTSGDRLGLVVVGDINGDWVDDLAASRPDNECVSIWLNNAIHFGAKRPLVISDSDGDAVRITLRGGGEGVLTPDNPIFLTGTTAKTVLTIAVRRGAAGDGLFHLSGISSDGLLKAINAGAVVVSGQVYLNTSDQASGESHGIAGIPADQRCGCAGSGDAGGIDCGGWSG